MLTIRFASTGDLDDLCTIEQNCQSTPWSAAQLHEDLLHNPCSSYLLALWQGEPAGYACVQTVADEAELLNIAVLPRFRRFGIGRVLLQAALQAAKQNGAQNLYLEVRAGNQPAIALYRGAGFSPCGRRAAYYTHPAEDALLFSRGLGDIEVNP